MPPQYEAAVTSGPNVLPASGRSGSPRNPLASVIAVVASPRTCAMTAARASPAQGPGGPPLPWQSATAPATCGAAWLVPVKVEAGPPRPAEVTQVPGAATAWAASAAATA